VLSQHPDKHRSERPVLLAVDQQLGEGAALGVPPVRADPVGSLEVRESQDVEEFGAGSGTRGIEALTELALDLLPGPRERALAPGCGLEFLGWRQGFPRRIVGIGQGKIRMTEPWVLPLAIVGAFLVGFAIGYRHPFSRRHAFAQVSTSRRPQRRL
jgi:hypothetical protein